MPELTLYERLKTIQSTNPYFNKDLLKAKKANKFIGRGSVKSSTHRYATAAGDLANTHNYQQNDIVFISAEGQRSGRQTIDEDEIKLAASAGATFITDDAYNRNRPYNLGEREVAQLLAQLGYKDNQGVWKK